MADRRPRRGLRREVVRRQITSVTARGSANRWHLWLSCGHEVDRFVNCCDDVTGEAWAVEDAVRFPVEANGRRYRCAPSAAYCDVCRDGLSSLGRPGETCSPSLWSPRAAPYVDALLAVARVPA